MAPSEDSRVSTQGLYQKQNSLLNISSVNTINKSLFLETNKYYLLFLHPEVDKDTTRSVFVPAYNIDQPPMVGSTPVQVPFGGEVQYYAPSATQYTPIQLTVIDRENLEFRQYLQELLLSFARPTDKTRLLKTCIAIYDHDNTFLTTMELYNSFISSISEISLDWNATSQLAVYSIEIQYSYYTFTPNQYNLDKAMDYYSLMEELF